jgi:hypothetical protein
MRELFGLTFVYRLADDIWVRLIGRGQNPSPFEIEKLRERWGPLFEKRIRGAKREATGAGRDHPGHPVP